MLCSPYVTIVTTTAESIRSFRGSGIQWALRLDRGLEALASLRAGRSLILRLRITTVNHGKYM